VIVSADADFGALLALGHLAKPSFVLMRSADHLTPTEQADVLLANLAAVAQDLERGAIVTNARGRLRIRHLPIEP
jgi:predicted nuclease of predicted toxin-antitoxin system